MRNQRGVALITVLLVVAVVTVVAAGLMARQQVAIRSTSNQLDIRQALHYAEGGEALAQALLQRDLLQGDRQAPVDHLGEAWAQPLPPFKLDEDGEIRVLIEDPSGRFNLNSLVRQGQVNEPAIAQFRRLLLRLGIDEPYPERLKDWLDADQEPSGSYGAEDNLYLLVQPPYRAANREMGDVSELRLLAGMQVEHYRRLLPFVSALPAEVPLNINTAGALVLSSLADGLDPDQAQALVLARGKSGFRDLQSFLALPGMAGLGAGEDGLAVNSQYFQVTSEVRVADRRQVLVSRLQRTDKGQVRVLTRDLGHSGIITVPVEESKK
jgi:general secretion pathway protein K